MQFKDFSALCTLTLSFGCACSAGLVCCALLQFEFATDNDGKIIVLKSTQRGVPKKVQTGIELILRVVRFRVPRTATRCSRILVDITYIYICIYRCVCVFVWGMCVSFVNCWLYAKQRRFPGERLRCRVHAQAWRQQGLIWCKSICEKTNTQATVECTRLWYTRYPAINYI